MDVKRPQFRPLTSDLAIETLVIGSGIAGLSIAYELMRRGHEVAVVDRGKIGGGMTARTSAHLSAEIDDSYHRLIKAHDEDRARRYYQSQKAAIDRIELICRKEDIECAFKRIDLYLFAPDHIGRRDLENEIKAATQVGFAGVGWSDAPVAGKSTGCLRFPNQARFHPIAYLAGLCTALKRKRVKFYSDTAIISVAETAKGAVAECENGHRIKAGKVVAATNSPFVNRLAVHNKQAPYRTYVMTAIIPKGAAPDALIWDTENPYHYVRLFQRDDDDLLVFGGEDHKTATVDDAGERLKRLERWARERFPKLGRVQHSWSGQVYEPVDYVPFIGPSPGHKRVFIVTGDSGEGLTTGVTASMILPDLIDGVKNPWAKVYYPGRKVKTPSPIINHAKDHAGAAKHLIEHLPAPTKTAEAIRRGKGAIIEARGKKHAAYRDKSGALHVMSAACTHVGCTVHWNSFEECWDCPCHGSQFAPEGEALNCPAVEPLKAEEAQMVEKKPARRKSADRERPAHHLAS